MDDSLPDFNPYASPELVVPESVGLPAGEGVWRHGRLLVMERMATLPGRCVHCNQPTDLRMKRKLTWCHPAWYLLLLCNLLICLIVVLIVSRRATIYIGLCQIHQRARRRRLWGGLLGLLGSIVLLIVVPVVMAGAEGPDWLVVSAMIAGGVGIIASLLVINSAAPVAPSRIDKQFICLRKVCPAYLAELPETAV